MIYIDGKSLCEVKDIEIETADISSPEAEFFIFNNDRTIEFEVTGIDTKFLAVDISESNPKFTIEYLYIRQVRKHKKKRINKKWLKRYGTKKEVIKIDNVEIKLEEKEKVNGDSVCVFEGFKTIP